MTRERESAGEFENEFRKFSSNILNIFDSMDVSSDLKQLFAEACDKYYPAIESLQRHHKDTELGNFLRKELIFFNRYINENGRKVGAIKILDAAKVILGSIGKHFSHWAIDILQEILSLANLFSTKED